MLLTPWVYPRACGATHGISTPRLSTTGLSPRVRGNHTPIQAPETPERSIPARAGQPTSLPTGELRYAVYPRACGATRVVNAPGTDTKGLSPRVRGNRLARVLPFPVKGSIPARAGQPRPGQDGRLLMRVYPRACGATRGLCTRGVAAAGLSPRVRGNPESRPAQTHRPRSIPARAGQPK